MNLQCHNDVVLVLCVLFHAHTTRNVTWTTGLSGKVERLANRHSRKMHIHLGSVDGFAAKVLVHQLWADTLVIDVRVLVNVEAVRLSSDGLQESRATRTRRTEHYQHLASLDKAI